MTCIKTHLSRQYVTSPSIPRVTLRGNLSNLFDLLWLVTTPLIREFFHLCQRIAKKRYYSIQVYRNIYPCGYIRTDEPWIRSSFPILITNISSAVKVLIEISVDKLISTQLSKLTWDGGKKISFCCPPNRWSIWTMMGRKEMMRMETMFL